MKSKSLRFAAASGAVAFASASLLSVAAGQAAAQGVGNIDPSAQGSLTVHKYLHQAGGAGSGSLTGPDAPAGWTGPVSGVEFTVHPLLKGGSPVDLTQAANWDGLSNLVPGANCTAPEGYAKGPGQAMPLTDAAGVSTLGGLDVSAYLVCETKAPANIVDRAAPFILTVPMPEDGKWVYNVHAYPKNGEGSIVKSITPQIEHGLGVGSQIEWPVSAPVPTLTGESWTGFAISDTFDSRLTPESVNKVTIGATTIPTSHYEVIKDGQTMTMNFTAEGLATLDGHAGEELTVYFNTTINEIGNGIVPNTADLWVNNPGRDSSVRPPLPSNEVKSNWGALQLVKKDSKSGNELAGAKFEVYNADPAYGGSCDEATPVGPAINSGGTTEFTSDEGGLVKVPGLFVSDSVNPTIDAAERCYVVKETAAPAGYVLPKDGAENKGVAVKIGSVANVASVEIVNSQQGVPDLPMTGGAGTGAMVGLGAAFMLGAGGLLMAKRRKDEEQTVTSA